MGAKAIPGKLTGRALTAAALIVGGLSLGVDGACAESMSRSVSVRDGSVRIYAPDQSVAVKKSVEIISTALWGTEDQGSVYRLDTGNQVEVELTLPKGYRDVRFKVSLVGFPDSGGAAAVILVNKKRRQLDTPASGESATVMVEDVDKDLVVGANRLLFGSASGRVGLQSVEMFYDAPPGSIKMGKEDSLKVEPKPNEEPKSLKAGDEFNDPLRSGGTGPRMVVIPAGPFVMGSYASEANRQEDEGPPHAVTIAKPFAVGKFEVTFEEWDACVLARACAPADDSGWGRGKRPVINVNYDQALGYTEWLSEQTGQPYRLLSEAEWEYAARAKTDMARHWGNSASQACRFANVDDKTHGCNDGYVNTAPVGSYTQNAFGLHDMLGNVWEWVEDCWNGNYSGAPADGRVWATGDCSRRVFRGGSWDNRPANVRSAVRYGFEPSGRYYYLGFRVARTLP
ncbi:MAG: formylglycine-generating enzyme family protein [Burkholderiales bacterium]